MTAFPTNTDTKNFFLPELPLAYTGFPALIAETIADSLYPFKELAFKPPHLLNQSIAFDSPTLVDFLLYFAPKAIPKYLTR